VLGGQLGNHHRPTCRHPGQRAGLDQAAAHGGGGQVGDHPAGPGQRLVEAGPVPPGGQQRLLGDVLGRVPAARQHQRQADQAGVLALVEVLEALGQAHRLLLGL
jgi:hypothetical protein